MTDLQTPWMRTFTIDGVETTETTHRTDLIRYFAEPSGKTFLDVGSADGYESRAIARLGAEHVTAIEAKQIPFERAVRARDHLGLTNLTVMQRDAREIDSFGFEPFDVVLCFGFLYHMQNPFSFLKRLRAATKGRLLLETHVAPTRFRGLSAKHARIMSFGMQRVELDGVPFDGKIIMQDGDAARHRGTVDAPWTFWLTPESLIKALTRAGFSIAAYYRDLDEQAPEIVRRRGAELGFGQANTKAWVVADAVGGATYIGAPSVRVINGHRWHDAVVSAIVRRL